MIILSFDVGIKNLAFCLLDSEKNILDWHIINCDSPNPTLKLIEELDTLDYLLCADLVLIEKQPSFNPKMRVIAAVLYVYFTMRIVHEQNKKIKIIYYHAKHKLKCSDFRMEFKTKNKYLQNKKLAIEHTRILITTHQDFYLKYILMELP